jgi:hypothetical protein
MLLDKNLNNKVNNVPKEHITKGEGKVALAHALKATNPHAGDVSSLFLGGEAQKEEVASAPRYPHFLEVGL